MLDLVLGQGILVELCLVEWLGVDVFGYGYIVGMDVVMMLCLFGMMQVMCGDVVIVVLDFVYLYLFDFEIGQWLND